MLQGIENIVFDLGGVMIDLDRARCVEEFHKIGFTEIDDLIDSYHPKGFLGRLERGDVTNDDFYDYVRRSAGRDIADDEIRRAFTSFLAGIPATSCKWCARSGNGDSGPMPSPTSTTWFSFRARRSLHPGRFATGRLFRESLSFIRNARIETLPEIYRKMIEKSGMRPEATLFIDDNAENLHTAQELGFHVYMPRPREDFRFLFDDGPGR